MPTLFSEFAPSFQRSIGALPFVALLIALGMDGLTRGAIHMWRRGTLAYLAVGWALLFGSIGLTGRAYFVEWAALPDLFPAWDVGFTQVAEQLVAADDGVRTYITPRGQDEPTLAYLLADHPETPRPEGFDGRICVRVATDVPARYYILDKEDFRTGNLLATIYPDSPITPAVIETNGTIWATRLDQPAGRRGHLSRDAAPSHGVGRWDWADGLSTLPPAGLEAGGTFYTRLYWQVSTQPAADYTAFAHLLWRNQAGDLVWLAGADRPPGDGSCPTQAWLPGEVVIDELQFPLPTDLPADLTPGSPSSPWASTQPAISSA